MSRPLQPALVAGTVAGMIVVVVLAAWAVLHGSATLVLAESGAASTVGRDGAAGGAAPGRGGHGAADGSSSSSRVEAALARALTASQELAHGGVVCVVTASETGPRIATMRVTHDRGALHLRRDGEHAWELGRADGRAVLRSGDDLLRLGGVGAPFAQLDRLRDKYRATLVGEVVLATGRASVLHLAERATGIHRESLYLDEETGLIVRRETFDRGEQPVRLVAYRTLDADPGAVEVPGPTDGDLREHVRAAVDVEQRSGTSLGVPRVLPGGYELVSAATVDASTPAMHLLYGDGLYTLSLFVQEGRLASVAVRGAVALETASGGTVWRWPGSEPRRVVWTGEGRTFTLLSDAPTDELLEVVAGLPVDPPGSMLDRLRRGSDRVIDWLTPGDGSET